tara:strand:+ start:582 stop:974 length:393 start_codon:yes stop_codon:yes gene_type:complete
MISKELARTSGQDLAAHVSEFLHPRTGKGVGRFRVKQIIAWNINGEEDSIKFSTDSPGYGVFELYDSGSTTPTSTELRMRVPISSKSRINLTIPQSGLTFEKGIWMGIGDNSSKNAEEKIYVQLVGYEKG